MFKEDIEWYIKNLECMKNDLYIAAAWKEVPRYTGATLDTVDTETKDEKELERRTKFLNVEIKKWKAQLDFYKEKEHE